MKRTPRSASRAGEDAVRGVGAGLLRLGTVALEDAGGLLRQVGQLRHGRLHAEGHFILVDPRLRLGVLILVELHPVQRGDVVEHRAAASGGDARRVRQEQHRVLARAEPHPLIARGQEAGAPHALVQRLRVRRSAGPRDHHDEGRQVLSSPSPGRTRPTRRTRAARRSGDRFAAASSPGRD